MTSGARLTSRDATPALTIARAEPEPVTAGELLVEQALSGLAQEDRPTRRPDPRSAMDARRGALHDPTALQLRSLATAQLKPKAFPPGQEPPPGLPLFQTPIASPGGTAGQGGKGGLFAPESKKNAAQAVAREGRIEDGNAYAADRARTRRRMDQLGLPRTGTNRIYVQDLDEAHGDAVTRAIAGRTGLAQGADLALDAPRGEVYAEGKKAELRENPTGNADPSAKDLVQYHARGLVGAVNGMAQTVGLTGLQSKAKNDGQKTFMNMSYGASPEKTADMIARRMLLSPQGSQLHAEATRILGHAPTIKDGLPDYQEAVKLKRELVYPALKAEMATPEFQAGMKEARERLTASVSQARKDGVMVFQAAGNDHQAATDAGDPAMSTNVTSGIPGIFMVGATKPNGAGTADDTLYAHSSAGVISAAAPGEGLPLGVNKDGTARAVSGTSFASPLMTETAYLVSNANPKLSIDQIERVLKDPRVARDVAGTDRDGAGVVDPLAASLVARYPRITSAQIAQIEAELDRNPNAKFTVLADGSLKVR